jgi:gliding motility-associated-like protein
VTVNLGDDQFINLGDPVTLNMQSNIAPQSILWTGPNGENWQGVSSLTISPMRTGRYDITIADENDCEATDHIMVYVEGGADAYLPTAFSPNGDGKNDRFTVFAGGDVKQIAHLQVFDRWGELVFEAHNFAPNDDLHLGWDGRHKGRAMDPALFIAMAEVELVDGTKKTLKGEVVLVK